MPIERISNRYPGAYASVTHANPDPDTPPLTRRSASTHSRAPSGTARPGRSGRRRHSGDWWEPNKRRRDTGAGRANKGRPKRTTGQRERRTPNDDRIADSPGISPSSLALQPMTFGIRTSLASKRHGVWHGIAPAIEPESGERFASLIPCLTRLCRLGRRRNRRRDSGHAARGCDAECMRPLELRSGHRRLDGGLVPGHVPRRRRRRQSPQPRAAAGGGRVLRLAGIRPAVALVRPDDDGPRARYAGPGVDELRRALATAGRRGL